MADPVVPASYEQMQRIAKDPRLQDPKFKLALYQKLTAEERTMLDALTQKPTDLEQGRRAISGLPELGKAAGEYVRQHPGEVGATAAAVPVGLMMASGGWMPAVAATTVAGAAGSGIGQGLSLGLDPDSPVPTNPYDFFKQVALHGAEQGAGEGGGRAMMGSLQGMGHTLMDSTIPAATTTRKQFPELAQTMLEDATNPFSKRGVQRATDLTTASRDAVDRRIAAYDARRPDVSGYLDVGTEPLNLGVPPVPAGGQGVTSAAEMASARQLDPMGFDPDASYFSYAHPTQRLSLSESGPGPVGDVVEGPGSVRRRLPTSADPGRGAPIGMVDPREIIDPVIAEHRGKSYPLSDTKNDLQALIDQFNQENSVPMTLTETNAMKRGAQDLANAGYGADLRGAPVNAAKTQFNQGAATGAQGAIERRMPEIADMNAETQKRLGVQLVAENASVQPLKIPSLIQNMTLGAGAGGYAAGIPGAVAGMVPSIATMPQIAPHTAIALYRAGQLPYAVLLQMLGPAGVRAMGILPPTVKVRDKDHLEGVKF